MRNRTQQGLGREPAHRMVKWIFDDEHGLLSSMDCRQDFVDLTSFILKPGAAASSHVEPTPVRIPRGALAASQATIGSQPGALASSQGGVGPSKVAEVPAASAEEASETAQAHKARHPKYRRDCARCRWLKHGRDWQRLVAIKERVTGKNISPIVEKPATVPGAWGLGCTLCANRRAPAGAYAQGDGRKSLWASFAVTQESVSLLSIRRHCTSLFHKDAVQDFQGASTISAGGPLVGGADVDDAGELQGVMTGRHGGGVPRTEKFVWAVRACKASHSDLSFKRFCEDNDLTTVLPASGVLRDSSTQACLKMRRAVAAVLKDDDQALLRHSVRMAFSEDDCDQTRIIRVRIVQAHPRVKVKEILGGLRRDFGYTAEENAEATWDALTRGLCTRLCGKRNAHQVHGPQDEIDPCLVEKLKEITFCGASDGGPAAISGIQTLKHSGRFPNLRYQFRDRPHTTRTIQKHTVQVMEEGHVLLEHFITKKGSFAKRAKHSRRFQEIWKRKQKDDPNDLYNVLEFHGLVRRTVQQRLFVWDHIP